MTILFISHYSAMYGANQSLCSLIVALKRKYNITPIVLLPREGEICAYLEQEGIRYVVSHYYWWVNNDKGAFQWCLNIRKQIRNRLRIQKLTQLFINQPIDLVYTNSITVNIGVYLCRRLKCPHVWHLRETLDAYGFKFSLGNSLSKHILKKGASTYIAISNFVASRYTGIIPSDKIKVIYNGVSLTTPPQKEVAKDDILRICIVGIVSEQKNQLDVVKALNILVNKRDCKNIQLHIIGGYKEEYLEQLNQYIKANLLDTYIVNHGHQRDIHSLLDQMDIGIVCARDEGFGRSTVEFMLHQMPVIASQSGANEEIVKEDTCGHLYPLYDVDKLADIIEQFVNDPALLDSMGQSAQKYAQANFSAQLNYESIFGEIKKLILLQ
ncbi:glycosyltransferase family 4 protein [Paludibacter sp.]|uniref:glycosyltransferase family 4 protein n=1 Tax=Paludibacter sp. TaxID=1898105 RepID=UPI001355C188|nr:glycosyltransferase family 4 protein [Paludibacter sp.]MTK52595.1 glycosyltransferase family 4 protein [Paludibacter sp.]